MRTFFLVVAGVLLLIIAGLELFIYLNRPVGKEELRVRAARLPELGLTLPDGKELTIPRDRALVLVYFNSSCDHCQREIEDIRQHLDRFVGAQLILMSAEEPETIDAYIKSIGMPGGENVVIAHVRHEVIAEKFGLLGLPQVFVYSAEGRLIDLFTGETSAQRIAGSLAQ